MSRRLSDSAAPFRLRSSEAATQTRSCFPTPLLDAFPIPRRAFPTPLFRSGRADAELLSDSASRRLSDSAARLSDSALPKRPRRRGAPFRLRFSTPFRFRSSEAAAQTRSCFLSDSGSRRLSDSAARFSDSASPKRARRRGASFRRGVFLSSLSHLCLMRNLRFEIGKCGKGVCRQLSERERIKVLSSLV